MEDFTSLLEHEITELRERHIRERKNTWLFKAEIKRRKSVTAVNQRRARVSPEVNTAMYDDERSEGSLTSIPKYLKLQRSPQVHPMSPERLSEDSHIRGSSIELRDLVKR